MGHAPPNDHESAGAMAGRWVAFGAEARVPATGVARAWPGVSGAPQLFLK